VTITVAPGVGFRSLFTQAADLDAVFPADFILGKDLTAALGNALNGLLELSGTLSGPAGLVLDGVADDIVILSGQTTYAGRTWVNPPVA
jgi:hypothetical protein